MTREPQANTLGEVRELVSTDRPIQALVAEAPSAHLFQLPPKGSGKDWERLAHRVTAGIATDEVIDHLFVWLGQPEDCNRTVWVNEHHLPMDEVDRRS